VDILYEPGFFTLAISPIVSPIIERFEIKIEDNLSLFSNGKGYIGFTASTGGFIF